MSKPTVVTHLGIISKVVYVERDTHEPEIRHAMDMATQEALRERQRMEGRPPYPALPDPNEVGEIRFTIVFK